ncbi:hypothetical protein GCM10007898_10100 [Dyella flagellata]|uniref:Uncharacterized protein n=1 Tax=Dyella flagellata TaxID=1867833 RepID=A0ABQ5X882_9GAMM|nr:hypothetical protein GCM10007898_10100 [Dyella flagellata]
MPYIVRLSAVPDSVPAQDGEAAKAQAIANALRVWLALDMCNALPGMKQAGLLRISPYRSSPGNSMPPSGMALNNTMRLIPSGYRAGWDGNPGIGTLQALGWSSQPTRHWLRS